MSTAARHTARILLAMLSAAALALPAAAQELTGTLKKIKDTGSITLGHRESSIPFSYYDDKQQVIGYSQDLCLKVVDAVKSELKMPNLQVKLNPVTSATRIPLMANGTIDLECGSTTNNLERQKQVAFSNPLRHGHPLRHEEDIGHQGAPRPHGQDRRDHGRHDQLKRLTEMNAEQKIGMNIICAKDHAEAFLMVEPGAPSRSSWTTSCSTAWWRSRRTRPSGPSRRTRSRSSPTAS